jgi:hypothetical protein
MKKNLEMFFFFPIRVYYATSLTLQQLISFVILNWAKASLFFCYGGPVSQGYGPALQIILDLCIPEKELAKTRSQISFI